MAALAHEFAFDAIGTRWSIATGQPLDAPARAAVAACIEDYSLLWSRFREDSLVARLAGQPGSHRLPAHAAGLAEVYAALHRATGGQVSPLVGSSLERLGYDAGYSLTPAGDPLPAPAWDNVDGVLAWNGPELATAAPLLLDVGAAGKGQLVDLVAGVLRARGFARCLVDAGGDMLVDAGGPVEVALEHPYDATRAIGSLVVEGQAICASAANRRAWGEGLHHVLDARTGVPVDSVAATWAVAESTLVADGVATGLFFASPARLAAESCLAGFSCVRMFSDGRAEYWGTLKGELFV
ncbi:FAD:protein FMN transferase [Arthrobacter sp. I2-34]|uniref:FAD:protein FMN transferase n=1 Tax=Arthrobacter hankyongi TaxID=2904801 RepID=A0ABS9LBA7_9MICC|nr:FAD:protein FMN transferase [Arthrobacter hankyongi]MCG2623978.1 FAD:protein FMN transferase [Arthrobacter hankyongi]